MRSKPKNTEETSKKPSSNIEEDIEEKQINSIG